MTFILKKADLAYIPFEDCCDLGSEELSKWATSTHLKNYESWLLPQLISYISTWTISKDENGLISPKTFFLDNIKGNARNQGIWKILTKLPRSELVKTQLATPQYSSLVPLILSAFKHLRAIDYSRWDRNGLEHLMSTELHEAATWDVEEHTVESLLNIRQIGLTIKSGEKMGQVKKPTSAWCLAGVQNTEIGLYPKLTQTMLTQIWVAHPSIRSPLMILDPKDWDNMPEPLINQEILVDAPKVAKTRGPGGSLAKPLIKKPKTDDLPW